MKTEIEKLQEEIEYQEWLAYNVGGHSKSQAEQQIKELNDKISDIRDNVKNCTIWAK